MSHNGNSQPWFAVRSLIYDLENKIYEERTLLINAESSHEAIDYAERHVQKYCQQVGLIYTGFSDSYHLFESEIKEGSEIFSLTRNIDISIEEYIDKFLDSGAEKRAERFQ